MTVPGRRGEAAAGPFVRAAHSKRMLAGLCNTARRRRGPFGLRGVQVIPVMRRAVRASCFLIVCCACPARAAIVVSIGNTAEQDALFWVETGSHYGLLHGGYQKDLDKRFLRPKESARIPVIMLNPVTFTFISASIYHPAYLFESRQVRERPSLINDVTVPEFEPRAWRDFIDSGEKVRHAGKGVHLENVIDHFRLFIDAYLPAIDAAGGGDLQGYLPLFEEIIRYTEQTLPQTGYGMQSIDERRNKDPAYAQRLDQHEQGRLGVLHGLLAEIRVLLSIGADARIRLRAQQAKLVNAGAVYHELMSAQDRQMIEDFLDFQFEHGRDRPGPESSRHWTGSGTTILYSITLGDHYTLNGKDGRQLYDNCYRTGLSVDLYGGVKTGLKDTQKRFSTGFCRNDAQEWVIQLPAL
jgi:hypothetical protein